MSDLIEAEGLIKSFGRVKALDGLDLGVGRGQIHGFLGPNGAGKSTTIRVLLGMYHTDGGRARVMGMDPSPKQCSTSKNLYVDASSKAISERTSYLQVRLEFLRYPQVIQALLTS